ncbi:hypothetical protein H6G04_31365 [Calothrix membranacea FACHB-236]|nr:hypothetical protein [Calothrix membranacea FACHB-236]
MTTLLSVVDDCQLQQTHLELLGWCIVCGRKEQRMSLAASIEKMLGNCYTDAAATSLIGIQ